MLNGFIISCESTTDLGYDYFKKRKMPVLFYRYAIDGIEYEDNMGRNKSNLDEFYDFLENGHLPTTSQINEYSYRDFFENLLNYEKKILHIAFGSGLTPSVENAKKAAKEINDELGEERIFVIDSTCGSAGYGLIVSMAYEFAITGKSIDETMEFVEKNKYNVHHQFFTTEMKYLKRSGRVTGVTATVATVLGICPIMHLNRQGKIIAYDKARGKKNAIKKTLEEMKQHIQNGLEYRGKCFINHSKCLADALELKKEIESCFKNLKGKIEVLDIGNIIASHCGPGTVAVYFLGDSRIV